MTLHAPIVTRDTYLKLHRIGTVNKNLMSSLRVYFPLCIIPCIIENQLSLLSKVFFSPPHVCSVHPEGFHSFCILRILAILPHVIAARYFWSFFFASSLSSPWVPWSSHSQEFGWPHNFCLRCTLATCLLFTNLSAWRWSNERT